MAGLPLDSWILILASVGLGLALEVVHLRARRGERVRDSIRTERSPDPADSAASGPEVRP